MTDDEIMSLYSIKASFDWDEGKFTKIYETTSSTEALIILTTHRIDVAFLDIRMPELNGFDIIEKCIESGVETYFVIVTGYSDFCYAQTAIRLRAIDYCVKPIDVDEAPRLLLKLHHLVHENRIKTDSIMLQRIMDAKDKEVQELLNYCNLNCNMPYYRVVCWKGDYFAGYCKIKTSNNDIVAFILDEVRCIFVDAHEQIKFHPIHMQDGECVVVSSNISEIDQIPALISQAQSIWLNSAEGITQFTYTGSGSESLQPILTYIESNLSKEINLTKLAHQFNFNYTYCSELFKKVTGTTFTNYLTKLRINTACDLLVHSNQSVKNICVQVGFSSYHYFANVFHKYIGMTPSQYRQGEQGKHNRKCKKSVKKA